MSQTVTRARGARPRPGVGRLQRVAGAARCRGRGGRGGAAVVRGPAEHAAGGGVVPDGVADRAPAGVDRLPLLGRQEPELPGADRRVPGFRHLLLPRVPAAAEGDRLPLVVPAEPGPAGAGQLDELPLLRPRDRGGVGLEVAPVGARAAGAGLVAHLVLERLAAGAEEKRVANELGGALRDRSARGVDGLVADRADLPGRRVDDALVPHRDGPRPVRRLVLLGPAERHDAVAWRPSRLRAVERHGSGARVEAGCGGVVEGGLPERAAALQDEVVVVAGALPGEGRGEEEGAREDAPPRPRERGGEGHGGSLCGGSYRRRRPAHEAGGAPRGVVRFPGWTPGSSPARSAAS